MLEVLEMLDRHGSRTGTLFASSPGLTEFRSGALPVKGLELVLEKRRRCGALSPESALAILQKPPPDALWTHDPPQGITTIYSPFAGTKFLELHYVKSLESSEGPRSFPKNNQSSRIRCQKRGSMPKNGPKKANKRVFRIGVFC